MIAAACAGSCTPASWITIWFAALLADLGEATPSLSTRLRMIETERSRSSDVSLWPFGGCAFSTTSSPPWRSRPFFTPRCQGEPGTARSADADEGEDDQRRSGADGSAETTRAGRLAWFLGRSAGRFVRLLGLSLRPARLRLDLDFDLAGDGGDRAPVERRRPRRARSRRARARRRPPAPTPWIPPAVMISSPTSTVSCIAECERGAAGQAAGRAARRRRGSRSRSGIRPLEPFESVALVGGEPAALDRVARAAGQLDQEA